MPRHFRSFSVLVVLGCVVHGVECGETSAAEPEKLVYQTPNDITFEITLDGLSAIHVGDRQLATGGWSVFNAEHWFKDSGSAEVQAKDIQDKAIQLIDAGRAGHTRNGRRVVCDRLLVRR